MFPLGMYTICTFRLSQVVEAPFLAAVSRGFGYVALLAWCVACVAMFGHLAGTLRATQRG